MTYALLIQIQIIILSKLLLTNTVSVKSTSQPCECDPFVSFVKYCGADGRIYDGCEIKCQKLEIISIGPCPENFKISFRRKFLLHPKFLYKETKFTLGKNISVVYK